jgi:L-alanine-DL-glutamate epimerase-like enolase superfamily enzyme
MLNIKLQKVGGISRALDALAIARAGGLPCLIGCMTETVVGITAGAHVALASPAVAHVDLDGHVDLAFQPATGGVTVDGDQLVLPDAPGLSAACRAAGDGFQCRHALAFPLYFEPFQRKIAYWLDKEYRWRLVFI